jgi:ribosome recycling factor
MIDEIAEDTDERMSKSLTSLEQTFGKLRTGRAHPALVSGIVVPYYGSDTPLNQVASVVAEDARTLTITPYERTMIQDVERAILKSDLGLTPSTGGESIRLPMPPLTEENRRDLTKIARVEAENARVAMRNIRRDANSDLKELAREKEITGDEQRGGEERVQQITNAQIETVDKALASKEKDLLEI